MKHTKKYVRACQRYAVERRVTLARVLSWKIGHEELYGKLEACNIEWTSEYQQWFKRERMIFPAETEFTELVVSITVKSTVDETELELATDFIMAALRAAGVSVRQVEPIMSNGRRSFHSQTITVGV